MSALLGLLATLGIVGLFCFGFLIGTIKCCEKGCWVCQKGKRP